GHVAAGCSNRAAVALAAVTGEDAVNHRERVAVVYKATAGVVQNPGPRDGQLAAAGDADPAAVPDEEAAQRDRYAAADGDQRVASRQGNGAGDRLGHGEAVHGAVAALDGY